MALLYILLVLSLVFDFLNGFHDSSNIVATIIFSRVLSPRKALYLTAVAEFAGPFLFGIAVAKTIGADIVIPGSISITVLIAAISSAILWNLITWLLGIPSSSSHALIGGILGAVMVGAGFHVVQIQGILKVLLFLFLSPILGFIAGFLVTQLVYLLASNASMRINWFFKNIQILTGIGLALSHGANDAQKTMGIIALGLLTTGMISTFYVPTWVIALSASAIALGTSVGGWRLIRTIGSRFYKIRPVNGFCIQVSSAIVILISALLGGPVSTTHVVSSSVMGVGSAERLNKVRWGVAGSIATAWLLTIPASALVAAGIAFLFKLLSLK